MKNISLAILVPLFLVPIIFSSCSKSVVVDYSSSWSDISVKDDNIKLLALGKKTPGILYAFSKRNMYVSKDAGDSFVQGFYQTALKIIVHLEKKI